MAYSKTLAIELKIPDNAPANSRKLTCLSLMAHLDGIRNQNRYDRRSTLSKIIILQRPRTGKQKQQLRVSTNTPNNNFMTRRKYAMSGNFNIHEDRKMELLGRSSEFASRRITTKDLVTSFVTQNKLHDLLRLDSCDQAAFKHILSTLDNREPEKDFTTEFLSTMTISTRKQLDSADKKKPHTASIYLRRSVYPQKDSHSTSRKKPFFPSTDMSGCFDERLHKYLEFLFMINVSNRIYRNLYMELERPLRYAVDRGNNANLIRNIMARRFLWEESERNPIFVWSQLKNRKLHTRQKPQQKLCIDVNFPVKADGSNSMSTFVDKSQLTTMQNTRKMVLKILSKQDWKYLSTELNGSKERLNLKARKLDKFIRTVDNPYYECIVTNHLKCNGLLGNKKALFMSLKVYYQLIDDDVWKYIPETYHITSLECDQYRRFCQSFHRNTSKVWIVKPGEDTNRGNGITILSTLPEITRVINKQIGPGANTKDRTFIVQYYISEPLLYQRRKFDIRAYMMITSNNGIIKGYWYEQGYIRTSGYLFSLDELSNTYKHLTNDAIQKYSQNYGKYEKGNKLGYSEFQRYLQLNNCKYNFYKDAYPIMKKIATDAIRATSLFLDPSRLNNNFEIFGLDFMIDCKFKTYLIEINTNPCLETGCPTLDRVIPNMLENAFRVGLDPIFPPPQNFPNSKKHYISENAMLHNNFELVFDELVNGPELSKLFREAPLARTEMQQISLLEESGLIYSNDLAISQPTSTVQLITTTI